MDPSPWVSLGDFNEIFSLDEKFGGSGHQKGLMENFQNTLEVCGMSDLGYRSPKYTWNNEREGADFTMEGLDRVEANQDWCALYQEVKVLVGVKLCSNHSPLFVFPKGQGNGQQGPHKFRFEVGWSLIKNVMQL